jgi:carboxypeptidase Taq
MENAILLQKYRDYWKNLNHYQNILSLLHWDSEVMMPISARAERADQISIISKQIHESFTSNEYGDLIQNLKEKLNDLALDSKNLYLLQREVEVLEKERSRSKKLPSSFVEEFAKTTNLAHGIWIESREKKDFSIFAPILEKIVTLSKQSAEYYGYEKERYDALLEGYETNTTASYLETLFKHLKNSLIPLVNESRSYPNPFKPNTKIEYQTQLCTKIPVYLGLNSNFTRIDASVHPFSTSLGAFDKRITTRYDENDPLSAVFSTLHECGHALYEYGVANQNQYPTPLTQSLSYGVHESMSRMWENQIGRSKGFWDFFYPILLKDLQIYHYDLPFDSLWRFINSVQKSKIRVESDQVTYNLHIILRYEIERELISGDLKIKELPELWNSKMKEFFDINIENDAEGVLQDVHWSGGSFGYFPTYTLGNIYSAQFFHEFTLKNENFWNEVSSRGDFSSLHKWLHKHIFSKGKLLDPIDLMKDITGTAPDSTYLIKYLKTKINEID